MPESFKVLVKELQALALDIRVLNDKGEEIELSTLCNDDEPSVYRRRSPRPQIDYDEDDIDAAVGQSVETDDLHDSYLMERNELDLDDASDDFGYESDDLGYEEESVYEANESYDEE